MNKVATFYKVSKEQFRNDIKNAFPDMIDSTVDLIYDKVLKLPQRATKGSAGYDFYSPIDFILKPGETIKFPTGIKCKMNEDYVLMMFPRSSLGFKYRMQFANTAGIIDSDFFNNETNEGDINCKFVNFGDKEIQIKAGDAVCQGLFIQYGITTDDEVIAERKGGIGSTNKN